MMAGWGESYENWKAEGGASHAIHDERTGVHLRARGKGHYKVTVGMHSRKQVSTKAWVQVL